MTNKNEVNRVTTGQGFQTSKFLKLLMHFVIWLNFATLGNPKELVDEMKPLNSLQRSFTEDRYQPVEPARIRIPMQHPQHDGLSDSMSTTGRSQNSDDLHPIIQPLPVRAFPGAPRVNAQFIQTPSVTTTSPSKAYKRPNPPITANPPPDITMNTPLDDNDGGTDDVMLTEMTTLDNLMKDLNNIRQQDFEC